MIPYHARPCITHDPANLFPHLRLITMDWTTAAGCLVFLKRAVFKPKSRVFHQVPAFVAEFIPPCMVMIPAVDTNHAFYGLLLSCHAGMHTGLGFLHAWVGKAKLFWYLPGRIRSDQLAGGIGLNT